MTAPINYQSPPRHRRRSWFPTVVIWLALLFGLGILFFRPVLVLLMAFSLSGTSKAVAPGEAAQSVAVHLMHWGVVGSVPRRDPAYQHLKTYLAQRITGIQGFTESDGFHGDGTDWYEVELSPDLASELRAGLAQSTTVKKSRYFPDTNSAPSWWPTTWPADAHCYEQDLQYLILPDSGTRAWFLRIRT